MAAHRKPAYSTLERRLAAFAADNQRLREHIAELEKPAPVFVALKIAAYDARVEIEWARRRILRGEVIGKKLGGRWVADPSSLIACASLHR